MIAGRLHWRPRGAPLKGRNSSRRFSFPTALSCSPKPAAKHRASLHVLTGEEGLHSIDPGGIDIFTSDLDSFRAALTAENRTLKRALTDPRILSGIGNAYSDEILHAAQLSPITLTHRFEAARMANPIRRDTRYHPALGRPPPRGSGSRLPEKVTAFRPDMQVHGRFGQPCLRCGEKIQRIRYADNETNYCARCQTAGKVLAIAASPAY